MAKLEEFHAVVREGNKFTYKNSPIWAYSKQEAENIAVKNKYVFNLITRKAEVPSERCYEELKVNYRNQNGVIFKS